MLGMDAAGGGGGWGGGQQRMPQGLSEPKHEVIESHASEARDLVLGCYLAGAQTCQERPNRGV